MQDVENARNDHGIQNCRLPVGFSPQVPPDFLVRVGTIYACTDFGGDR